MPWVWQQPDWPNFHWQDERVQPLLREVRLQLGVLVGKAGAMDMLTHANMPLDTLLQNIIASSEIEGESLDVESVRSSLAKKLGVKLNSEVPSSDRSDGVVEIMMDAISCPEKELTLDRLFQWHCCLFPANVFSLQDVIVGKLRGGSPMQVVSGRIDRPRVHFEAPPRFVLDMEMTRFIHWFNVSRNDVMLDPLLRAAMVHFYFITLHPFDDGNGRIARALTDLALAQADEQSIRLYAISPTIMAMRKTYYEQLESSQRGNIDISNWIVWFLEMLNVTLQRALDSIECTISKARFWRRFQDEVLLPEQLKVLNRLLDGGEKGFEHGISASQYQKVAGVSKATATRHLVSLVNKGAIKKLAGGGRNTRYVVCV